MGFSSCAVDVLAGAEKVLDAAMDTLNGRPDQSHRQVGILAASGIVALDTLTDRLEEDHFRAQQLAAGLACGTRDCDLASRDNSAASGWLESLALDTGLTWLPRGAGSDFTFGLHQPDIR